MSGLNGLFVMTTSMGISVLHGHGLCAVSRPIALAIRVLVGFEGEYCSSGVVHVIWMRASSLISQDACL